MIATVVMLVAATLCFGVACFSRVPTNIFATAVMLAAMGDHALTGWVSSVMWAALLLGAGVLLAIRLRFAAPVRETGYERSHGSAAMVAALTYPVMAWFVLRAHASPQMQVLTETTPQISAGLHQHGAQIGSLNSIDTVIIVVAIALASALTMFAVRAIREKRHMRVLDAGGMGTMLLAAAIPTLVV